MYGRGGGPPFRGGPGPFRGGFRGPAPQRPLLPRGPSPGFPGPGFQRPGFSSQGPVRPRGGRGPQFGGDRPALLQTPNMQIRPTGGVKRQTPQIATTLSSPSPAKKKPDITSTNSTNSKPAITKVRCEICKCDLSSEQEYKKHVEEPLHKGRLAFKLKLNKSKSEKAKSELDAKLTAVKTEPGTKASESGTPSTATTTPPSSAVKVETKSPVKTPQKASTPAPQKGGTKAPQQSSTSSTQKTTTPATQKNATSSPAKSGATTLQKSTTQTLTKNVPSGAASQKSTTSTPQKSSASIPTSSQKPLTSAAKTGPLKPALKSATTSPKPALKSATTSPKPALKSTPTPEKPGSKPAATTPSKPPLRSTPTPEKPGSKPATTPSKPPLRSTPTPERPGSKPAMTPSKPPFRSTPTPEKPGSKPAITPSKPPFRSTPTPEKPGSRSVRQSSSTSRSSDRSSSSTRAQEDNKHKGNLGKDSRSPHVKADVKKYCSDCQVTLPSAEAYSKHVQGIMHENKVAARRRASSGRDRDRDRGSRGGGRNVPQTRDAQDQPLRFSTPSGRVTDHPDSRGPYSHSPSSQSPAGSRAQSTSDIRNQGPRDGGRSGPQTGPRNGQDQPLKFSAPAVGRAPYSSGPSPVGSRAQSNTDLRSQNNAGSRAQIDMALARGNKPGSQTMDMPRRPNTGSDFRNNRQGPAVPDDKEYCTACNISLPNHEAFVKHIGSMLHQKRAGSKSHPDEHKAPSRESSRDYTGRYRPALLATPPGPKGGYQDSGRTNYCSLCDIQFLSEETFQRHTKGLMHLQKAKAAESTEGKPFAKISYEDFLEGGARGDAARKRKMEDDKKFYCNLCDAQLPSAHMFKAHMERLHNRTGLLPTPGDDDRNSGKISRPSCLKTFVELSTQALIGLNYVTEYQHPTHDTIPTFYCRLCEMSCDYNTIKPHVVSYKHRIFYFKKHEPGIADEVRRLAGSKLGHVPNLEHFARETESKVGKGEVMVRIDETTADSKASDPKKSRQDDRHSADKPKYDRYENRAPPEKPRYDRYDDRVEHDHPRQDRYDDRTSHDSPRYDRYDNRGGGERHGQEQYSDRSTVNQPAYDRPDDRYDSRSSSNDRPGYDRYDNKPPADNSRFSHYDDRAPIDNTRYDRRDDRAPMDNTRYDRHDDRAPVDNTRHDLYDDRATFDNRRYDQFDDRPTVDKQRYDRYDDRGTVDNQRYDQYDDRAKYDNTRVDRYEDKELYDRQQYGSEENRGNRYDEPHNAYPRYQNPDARQYDVSGEQYPRERSGADLSEISENTLAIQKENALLTAILEAAKTSGGGNPGVIPDSNPAAMVTSSQWIENSPHSSKGAAGTEAYDPFEPTSPGRESHHSSYSKRDSSGSHFAYSSPHQSQTSDYYGYGQQQQQQQQQQQHRRSDPGLFGYMDRDQRDYYDDRSQHQESYHSPSTHYPQHAQYDMGNYQQPGINTSHQDTAQGAMPGNMFSSMSGCMVNNEEDAEVALQVSSTLTQALLQYKLQSSAAEGSQGIPDLETLKERMSKIHNQ